LFKITFVNEEQGIATRSALSIQHWIIFGTVQSTTFSKNEVPVSLFFKSHTSIHHSVKNIVKNPSAADKINIKNPFYLYTPRPNFVVSVWLSNFCHGFSNFLRLIGLLRFVLASTKLWGS